jgi:hypothetical protein
LEETAKAIPVKKNSTLYIVFLGIVPLLAIVLAARSFGGYLGNIHPLICWEISPGYDAGACLSAKTALEQRN